MKSETPMTMARIIGKFKGRTFIVQSELQAYADEYEHSEEPHIKMLADVMRKLAKVCANTISETDADWNSLWKNDDRAVLDVNKSI
jgi:hypothetical protein